MAELYPGVRTVNERDLSGKAIESKLILLVEDNPDDEALALRALARTDLPTEVVVARDGAEALDFLFATGPYEGRDGNVLPAVVLLDLKLPKVDGLDVLRRVRADPRTRFLPVVVMSSSDESRDVAESYRVGASSYIRKPVDFGQFTETVRQLGTYWLVLNDPPPVVRA
jgi:CheY-like chemotaxis protein